MKIEIGRHSLHVTRAVLVVLLGAAIPPPAGAELSSAEIGPDGHAYQLIDCAGEDGSDSALCPGTGPLTWTQAAEKAAGLSYREYTACHLATPSTKNVDDYLKAFDGFAEACGITTITDLELCAWIGGRDVTPGVGNGPYEWIDASPKIPCTSGDCEPIVQTGVNTTLSHEGWCRTVDGCGKTGFPGDEPNNASEDYMGYLMWTDGEDSIGWHDCTDNCFGSFGPTSYFVECEAPPPACPEVPGCYCASDKHTRRVKCNSAAPWIDRAWQYQCEDTRYSKETPVIIMEQPSDRSCKAPRKTRYPYPRYWH